ncbi:MAG: DNA gyrase inhibitor YacG [Alphaproteobacteria bacterium]
MAERRCPRCGDAAAWEGNPHRPFCSARCRLVDLEGWLGGRYAIPGEPTGDPEASADGSTDGVFESAGPAPGRRR